jgi:hypothetical protein
VLTRYEIDEFGVLICPYNTIRAALLVPGVNVGLKSKLRKDPALAGGDLTHNCHIGVRAMKIKPLASTVLLRIISRTYLCSHRRFEVSKG